MLIINLIIVIGLVSSLYVPGPLAYDFKVVLRNCSMHDTIFKKCHLPAGCSSEILESTISINGSMVEACIHDNSWGFFQLKIKDGY